MCFRCHICIINDILFHLSEEVVLSALSFCLLICLFVCCQQDYAKATKQICTELSGRMKHELKISSLQFGSTQRDTENTCSKKKDLLQNIRRLMVTLPCASFFFCWFIQILQDFAKNTEPISTKLWPWGRLALL